MITGPGVVTKAMGTVVLLIESDNVDAFSLWKAAAFVNHLPHLLSKPNFCGQFIDAVIWSVHDNVFITI